MMNNKNTLIKKLPTGIFWFLVVAIVFSSGLYVYLINDSVSNIALRKNNENKMSEMEAEVSFLESSYLDKLGEVNMDYAIKLGFVDASKSTTYAVLDQSATGLVAVKNEI